MSSQLIINLDGNSNANMVARVSISTSSHNNPLVNVSTNMEDCNIHYNTPTPISTSQRSITRSRLRRNVTRDVPRPQTFSLLGLQGNPEPTEEVREQCIICMNNRRNILFQPCRHVSCCVVCARKLGDETPSKCPQCRKNIAFAETIYL